MKPPLPSTRRSFLIAATAAAAGIALTPAILPARPQRPDPDSPAARLARRMYCRGEFGALLLAEAELHGWPASSDGFDRCLAALIGVIGQPAAQVTRLRGDEGSETRFYDTAAGIALRIAVLPAASRDRQPRLRFYGQRLSLFADDGCGATAVIIPLNRPPQTIDLRSAGAFA